MRFIKDLGVSRSIVSALACKLANKPIVESIARAVQTHGGRCSVPLLDWQVLPSRIRKFIRKKYAVTINEDMCFIESKKGRV